MMSIASYIAFGLSVAVSAQSTCDMIVPSAGDKPAPGWETLCLKDDMCQDNVHLQVNGTCYSCFEAGWNTADPFTDWPKWCDMDNLCPPRGIPASQDCQEMGIGCPVECEGKEPQWVEYPHPRDCCDCGQLECPRRSSTSPKPVVSTSTSVMNNGTCIDDTDMFGQMPEPKCRFLLGEMLFQCNWTLSQIKTECPACGYNYAGKDMSTPLSNLCCATCGQIQPNTSPKPVVSTSTSPKPVASTSTSTSPKPVVSTSTRVMSNGTCIDDTDMFGQMPEPKCRFLLGEMGFQCNWTLSQIKTECPACGYNYTGKDMSTPLSNLCCTTCGQNQPGITVTSTSTDRGIPLSGSSTLQLGGVVACAVAAIAVLQ